MDFIRIIVVLIGFFFLGLILMAGVMFYERKAHGPLPTAIRQLLFMLGGGLMATGFFFSVYAFVLHINQNLLFYLFAAVFTLCLFVGFIIVALSATKIRNLLRNTPLHSSSQRKLALGQLYIGMIVTLAGVCYLSMIVLSTFFPTLDSGNLLILGISIFFMLAYTIGFRIIRLRRTWDNRYE